MSFNVSLLNDAATESIRFLHSTHQIYVLISNSGRFDQIFLLFPMTGAWFPVRKHFLCTYFRFKQPPADFFFFFSLYHSRKLLSDSVFLLPLLSRRTPSLHEQCLYVVLLACPRTKNTQSLAQQAHCLISSSLFLPKAGSDMSDNASRSRSRKHRYTSQRGSRFFIPPNLLFSNVDR